MTHIDLSNLALAADDETAQQKKKARIADRLAKRFAAGEEIDLDEINGTPKNEILSLVPYHTGRHERRAVIDQYGEALRERNGILDDKAAAARKLELAQQEYNATVRPLDLQLQKIADLSIQAAAARRELIAGCNDQDLLAREQHVRRMIQLTDPKVKQQRRAVENIAANLQNEKSKPAPGALNRFLKPGDGLGGDPEKVAVLQKRHDSAQAELVKLRSELDELIAESDAIVEKKVLA